VRVAAIRSLGLHAERGPEGPSRAAALHSVETAVGDEPLVVLAALEVLRRVGGLPPAQLAQLLVRREAEIVREAVVCAGARSEEASLDQLLPLVSHPDWSVRAEAIQVLADRRVTKAVPTILRRLEAEQDGFVRDAILRALERLEG
jgi:HEAT repeat protein